jgi:sulfur-carrier protein adenylyltransferase/sulfurtransferase
MQEPQPSAADPTMTVDQVKGFLTEHEPGSFLLLDVRQPAEYEEIHIPGARLIPLPELPDAIPELDPAKSTVVYCAVGGRSKVAVQLLRGQGFQHVFSMTGGIYAWEGLEAVGPQELNLDMVRGDESPHEMFMLAYQMEHGLGRFYDAARVRAKDTRVVELLTTLVGVEERHKQKLEQTYATLMPENVAPSVALQPIGSEIMEGGFRMDEFMTQNQHLMDDREKVLEMAIMLESQALDLYLRFAEKIQVETTRGFLYGIAQEEKQHLAALGRLYDETA